MSVGFCSAKALAFAERKPTLWTLPRFFQSKLRLLLIIVCTLIAPAAACAQSTEGFAEPVHLVNVASPEAGTIQEVLVRQGQTVKKGDPLIQMDQETLLPALALAQAKAEARAKLEAAKIELQVKQRRLENFNRLGKENSSSEEMLRATADVELAKTSVMAAEEEIRQNVLDAKRIEAQLARRTIRSPINGVVTRIHHHDGEFITTAEPQLVTVADLSQLRIVFHPTSREAEELAATTSTSIRLERGNEIVPTTIDFISPVTSADSGTVRVELLLENPDGKYRSGIRCWLLNADAEEIPRPRTAEAARK
ncbi:MAG: efflux RND transporter periplasmic adaptor subunit [Fuerstia sp.]|nr:efflux RND transporter periplasmic adaptor subunit [Fuerstiella sp.]